MAESLRPCPQCGRMMDSKRSMCVYCVRGVMNGDTPAASSPTPAPEAGRVNLSAPARSIPEAKTDVVAVLSFAFGLLAFFVSALFFAPVALVLSFVSHYRLKENDDLKGQGLKNYGFAFGVLGSAWAAFVLCGGLRLLGWEALAPQPQSQTAVTSPAPVQQPVQPAPVVAQAQPASPFQAAQNPATQPAARFPAAPAASPFQPAQPPVGSPATQSPTPGFPTAPPATAANSFQGAQSPAGLSDAEKQRVRSTVEVFDTIVEARYQIQVRYINRVLQGDMEGADAAVEIAGCNKKIARDGVKLVSRTEEGGYELYVKGTPAQYMQVALENYLNAGTSMLSYIDTGNRNSLTEATTHHSRARSAVEALRALAR